MSLRQLTVADLRLDRGDRTLVDGLSLALSGGEAAELVGPNGSGKTTLLRALAGLFQPTRGEIRLLQGKAMLDDRSAHVHLQGHQDGLKGALSAHAHALYWARLLGGDPARVDAALERVGLARIADLPARALSRGQGRRLALTRLITAPRPVWLLDEPAAGLDTAGKGFLRSLIQDHVAAGGIAVAAVHEPLLDGAGRVALGEP